MRLLLALVLLPTILSAQFAISGRVVQEKTGEGIAYATIGLARANTGVTANENGVFNIIAAQSLQEDTLIVSCVGYLTKKIAVKDLPKNDAIVELQAFVQELTPVVVGKRDWQYVRLNDNLGCSTTGVSSYGTTTQIAQLFISPEENGYLASVEICRFSIPIIAPQKAVFRLRIYDMDSATGKPKDDLCKKVIEVKSNTKHVFIDISEYKIQIPKREFFIAIEWLKIPVNEEVVLERDRNGRRSKGIHLKPTIFWAAESVSTPSDVWMLTYNNKWFRINSNNRFKRLAIVATIKY